MKSATNYASWITLPQEQRMLTGGCWPERCYPFRGVFSEERLNRAVEQQRMLEDFRLVMQEFNSEVESRLSEPDNRL